MPLYGLIQYSSAVIAHRPEFPDTLRAVGGQKLRYEIDLATPVRTEEPSIGSIRPVTHDDLDGLATLMLDAYVGTIDYEDENLDDAIDEVRSYLEGAPLLDHSYVVYVDDRIASAVLVSLVEGTPFVGYVMTLPVYKNQGLARAVTKTSMSSLATAGYAKLVLYITEGNEPSEALFRSVGAAETAAT